MSELPVLELQLRRRQEEKEGEYIVDMRYRPGGAGGVSQSRSAALSLDLTRLRFQIQGSEEYARELTKSFLADPAAPEFIRLARASAADQPLRVRLFIDEKARELHGVHWELLCETAGGPALFVGEDLYFSRYLESDSWRQVHLRPRKALRALAVVSSPSDIADYPGLEGIAVGAEVERARQSLGDSLGDSLCDSLGDIPLGVVGQDEPATLENLAARLVSEKPDILYLVCHGRLMGDEAYLLLQKPNGNGAMVTGAELVKKIEESGAPLLIILASCQSAGYEDAPEMRVALGPRLAAAGVPAVVAMQGKIALQTLEEFMPAFFAALEADGQVDRAMAKGRARVKAAGQPDYWMPVLFTRLEDATIFEEKAAAPEARHDWRYWAILAAVVLLGFAAVIAFLAWPRERDMRKAEECQFCVAVAGFQVIGKTSEKDLGTIAASTLSGQLELNFKELEASTASIIRVWGPKDEEAGMLKAPTLEDLDRAAETLAKAIHADVVVYGQVEVLDAGWKVTPRFYISPYNEFKNLQEVTGQHELGVPYEVSGSSPAARRAWMTRQNTQRARLLASIVIGESYMVSSEYPRALEILRSAQARAAAGEQDPAAGKLLYVLMGNAASRVYQSSLKAEDLDQAEGYYTGARNLDASYARAYLGLSSVSHLRAMQKAVQTEDPADVDFTMLEKSIAFLKQAEGLAPQPDLARVREKVAFGLGEEYFSRAYFSAMTGGQEVSFDPAIAQFSRVISAYENGGDEVLQELAAEAHARLGVIYQAVGDLPQAEEHYRQALELNTDSERGKLFKENLETVEAKKKEQTPAP